MMGRSNGFYAIAGFLLISLIALMSRPLLPIDETRYIDVAWEMWLSKDYFHLTRNFEPYSHKPPLLFWSINIIWAFFGVSEIAARVMATLYGVLAILSVYALTRRLFPEDKAIAERAMLVFATCFLFSVEGSAIMFDALLTTITIGGIYALLGAMRDGRYIWWAGVGLAIGLGVLAKGPVIFLHLAPAILLAYFWTPNPENFSWGRWLKGLLLALGVGLFVVSLWLLPVLLTSTAEYREAILWKQSAGRVSNSFAHAKPIWFYIINSPILLLPWLFSFAVWKAIPALKWQERRIRLLLIWGLSAFILFSLVSGKQFHYLFPELPAFAIMIASLPIWQKKTSVWGAIAFCILAFTGIVLYANGYNGTEVPILFTNKWAFVLSAGILVIVFWISDRLKGLHGLAFLSFGFIFGLYVLFALSPIRARYDTQNIGHLIAPYDEAGIAFYHDEYHAEFNFPARLKNAVAVYDSDVTAENWIKAHPEGVIIAELDATKILDWEPVYIVPYRTSEYGIWRIDDKVTN